MGNKEDASTRQFWNNLSQSHRDAIEYLTESADLLFEKNRLDEASERFRQVIALNPKSKQAEKRQSKLQKPLHSVQMQNQKQKNILGD